MPIGAALASHPVVVGDGGGSTKRTQHAKLRVGDEECGVGCTQPLFGLISSVHPSLPGYNVRSKDHWNYC